MEAIKHTYNQDITISVDIPQPDGTTTTIYLTEFDNVEYVEQLANISKRVAISDTADLIFRLFAQSYKHNKQLNFKQIPDLQKYTKKIEEFFNTPDMIDLIKKYNDADDKAIEAKAKANTTTNNEEKQKLLKEAKKYEQSKRELRNIVLYQRYANYFVEKTIEPKDLQYNFSKFKYKFDTKEKPSSFKEKMSKAISKIKVRMHGMDMQDPFLLATYDEIWKENLKKRQESKRQAYWMLIRDTNQHIIGIICISSRQLKDGNLIQHPFKDTNNNPITDKDGNEIVQIIGHSGYIIDPSAQGRGYGSILNAVMVDFMYDNIEDDVANNSLFATTCDIYNENSQGMQKKTGARLLTDDQGHAVIDTKQKMHWYATKDDIMHSDLMTKAKKRDVQYKVLPKDGHPGYSKKIGDPEHSEIIDINLKGISYDR